MKTWVKWVIGVGGALLALVVVALLVVVWLIRRPFPDIRGRHEVTGITASVEILRDEFGVPHIWAKTAEDLYFAQGYVHAQDRFWQMEFSRRVGSGRLSELLGEPAIAQDQFLRTMGFAHVAELEYAGMHPEHRRWLDAYARGVNNYINSRPPEKLALEFALLALTGAEPVVEPWTAVNSLTWGKVMGLSLGTNYGDELQNMMLSRFGGRRLYDAVNPPYRSDMPFIISSDERREGTYVMTGGGPAVGSNSWVIGGELTATGEPIVANDMHLGIQMPSIWYEVGLHLDPAEGSDEAPMDVRGYSFPGVPGVVAGQNESIAWGITNLGGDVQDLVLEEIDPENPNRYLRDGDSIPMSETLEVIHVAGNDDPVVHRVRRTDNGPIITDLPMFDSWFSYTVDADELPPRPAFSELSLRWTSLSPRYTVEAIFELNRAGSYDEFRAALSRWGAPGQNFVFAGSDGTIAYQSTGSYPSRDPRLGLFPTDTSASEIVPFDELPSIVDPVKGFIVTANNPVVPGDDAVPMGASFANGRRAARITELIMEAGAEITPDTVAGIQADTFSIHASELTPHLLRVDPDVAYDEWLATRQEPPWLASQRAGEQAADRDLRLVDAEHEREQTRADDEAFFAEALSVLADWDHTMDADSPGALVFGYINLALLRAIFADEVPVHQWPFSSALGLQDAVYALLSTPNDAIWDDRTTEARAEDRDATIARAVAQGLFALRQDHGDEPAKWRWGDAHQVEFRNQSLGESGIGIIERIFNRGPYPANGDSATVNVAHWELRHPFDVTLSVSQRAIYDLSDPSNSRFVHTTGQSGHPFSRHYADMIEPWTDGAYHPSNWTYEQARASAGRRRLILELAAP